MRILIVSGIFEPEVGGPATYAPQLARELVSQKDENVVTVVTLSPTSSDEGDPERGYRVVRVVRGRKLLNRLRFFLTVRSHVQSADIVYMLDWFAAGVPTALAAKFYGKPYIVRVGGDYLWEQRYLEGGKPPLSLADFYETGKHKKYPLLLRIIRWVLQGASHVVFNSDRQRELYMKYYSLDPDKVSTLYNPRPDIGVAGRTEGNKEFVFWGRFIVLKNLDSLIRAFAQAKIPSAYTLTLIGDGPRKQQLKMLADKLGLHKRITFLRPMPRTAAWERVKNSRAFILPSWTDISPNQVYEALALRLPALITSENYLSIAPQLPETVDPRSVGDITAKLEMLADDAKYEAFGRSFRAISYDVSWDDVARAHRQLFESVVAKKV